MLAGLTLLKSGEVKEREMPRCKIVARRLNIYAEAWNYQSCFNVEVSLKEMEKGVKGCAGMILIRLLSILSFLILTQFYCI